MNFDYNMVNTMVKKLPNYRSEKKFEMMIKNCKNNNRSFSMNREIFVKPKPFIKLYFRDENMINNIEDSENDVS